MANGNKRKSYSTTPVSDAGTNKRIKVEPSDDPHWLDAKKTKMSTAACSVYDEIVYLKLEPTKAAIPIHKGLLRRHSSWFKAALSDVDRMEKDNGIILNNQDADVVTRFIHWVYTKKIVKEGEAIKEVPWALIVDVYIFGEAKGIPGLQNACIDMAILKEESSKIVPGPAVVARLWQRSYSKSPLRWLLLHLFARNSDLAVLIPANKPYPPDFLQGLVLMLYQMKEDGTAEKDVDLWKDRSRYYMRGETNPIFLG